MSASRPTSTPATTSSTPSKVPGTPVASKRAETADTRPVTRVATSPFPRSITTPTSATKWFQRCCKWDCRSSALITKSAPPARARSTTNSIRCCTRPTTSCSSSTSSRTSPGRTARPPRSCLSLCSTTTAPVCTATSRYGKTGSRCSTTRWVTADCPTPPVGTSAVFWPTHPRYSRSPTRRSTATTDWCRASKLPSTLSTPPATAPPRCVFRSRVTPRRPSAWSSACRTRPATPTSPSPHW